MNTVIEKTTDRQRVTEAFKELRKKGYFARMNHLCCQSCGWAYMSDEQSEKAVFYHRQDHDTAWDEENNLEERYGLYLAWAGDGKEITEVLEKHGLKVEWNGSDNTRIKVVRNVSE
jgi:hypothetical protein